MPSRQLDRISFSRGFVPTAGLVPGLPESIIDGQNVLVLDNGLVVSAKGPGSAGSSGGVAELINIAGTHGGMTVSGCGVAYGGSGVYFFGGVGSLIVGGATIGAVSGSTVTIHTASYDGPAGITAPGASVIAASATSGKNNGSYSIALTAIRSTTGAESSRGAISNAVAVSSKKIKITTFPTVPTGANKWGIYASKRGFATVGPWYHLLDIPTSTTAPYEFDWYDGELGTIASLDNDPPPTCTHVFSINNVIVAAGCYGNGLSPSKPSFPEAFPPQTVIFLPGSGVITSCKATGIEGTVFVATATSLLEVRATGDASVPIQVIPRWANTGFASGSAWCVTEDAIVGFSGQNGAVIAPLNGDPITTFAADVQSKFTSLGFTATNTVVGYDPHTNCFVFASGSNALLYNRGTNKWSPTYTLGFTATTSVTVAGHLLISASGGAMSSPETGSGTTWFFTGAWRDGGYAGFPKTFIGLRGHVGAQCQMDVYKNLNLSSSQATKTAAVNHGAFHKLNVQGCDTFTVKFSGADSGGTPIFGADGLFIPHSVRV